MSVQFEVMENRGLLVVTLAVQQALTVMSTSWHARSFMSDYLRGDSLGGLYPLAAVAVFVWATLLVVQMRLMPSDVAQARRAIMIVLCVAVLSAVVVIVHFKSLILHYPVLYMGSWMVSLIVLTSGLYPHKTHHPRKDGNLT